MDMSGEYRIPASREEVWDALNDVDVLKAAIPGCEELERLSATELTARVVSKIGPVKATFKGGVTLSDLDPPNGYHISGEGKGGVAGFAKGGADVRLVADGAETILTYAATAKVGGKLAQLGSRLLDSSAKKLADEFFGNVTKHFTGELAPAEGVLEHAVHEVEDAVRDAEAKLEIAAFRNVLGGPAVWGTVALALLVALILVLNWI